ncbi:MAG: M20 family metallopeptidase [Acidobacteria bacterium]|nr:M20 family metallopeptidase [Acidobacteriota bacterium]
MNDLLEFCESQRAWLLETIESLVRRESPSTDKTAVDRCGAELARRLEAIGARVQILPRQASGDHLLAETGCGAGQVLLLGHFDTVWPLGQIVRMPLTIEGGRLHGPGVFDMKAGIAIGLLAARALQETRAVVGHRVVMLWTADEEIGSGTSRTAIEEEARRSDAVLVLEPALPGGAVKTSRKGCGEFELVVRGISAHAGIDPGKGASAIHELARQIVAVERLRDHERGISINVGVISGGTRTNVVAEEARAHIDVRVPRMGDAARVEAAFKALAPEDGRTTIELDGGFGRPPLERSPAVVRLYELAREISRGLGRPLAEGGTGGGSDGNFTAALGVPTLDGLGAIGEGAHAIHEYVLAEELCWRAALVAGLIQRLTRQ